MISKIQTAYLAAEGFLAPLIQELSDVHKVVGRLVLTTKGPQPAYWAQNIWLSPESIKIASISDAAAQLKSLQRNWSLYSFDLHRRASLIQEKLPHVSAKPLVFPAPLPSAPLGSWTLLDKDTVLASARCTSPFPNGEAKFEEDKTGPPSRAYLKLWEAWTYMADRPQPGQFCLDIGGSPGGWAWAVQQLGARVLSVDRSPLAQAVSELPGVAFQKGDSFALDPASVVKQHGPVDWLLSDVICYPDKLYHWVGQWLDSGLCKNFVCTLKFQEGTDYAAARKFATIPHSRVLHLHHNKHELTWLCQIPE